MELTEDQRDMFNEIGNVGVGHAATALSTMVGGKKVNITLPSTDLIKKEDIIKDQESELLLVDCRLEGDLTGNLVVIYNRDNAFPLIDMLLGNEVGTLKDIDDMAKSVFKEMVNIIAGPYLDSLATLANMRVLPQPPTFVHGKLISIKDGLMAKLPPVEDIISIQTEMSVEEKIIFGRIYLVLDGASMDKLMKTFGQG